MVPPGTCGYVFFKEVKTEEKLHLRLQRAQLWVGGWLAQSGVHCCKHQCGAGWLLRNGIERAKIKLALLPNWLFPVLLSFPSSPRPHWLTSPFPSHFNYHVFYGTQVTCINGDLLLFWEHPAGLARCLTELARSS